MKAIARILKTLSAQSTPRTSAELKADLAAIDIPMLKGIVEALAIERKVLLRTASDDQLRASAAKLDDARLAVERGEAITEELQRQIADAEKHEAAQQVEAQAAEAQQSAARLAELYAAFDELVRQAQARLAEAGAAAAVVTRWNRTAERSGQPERKLQYVDVAVKKQQLAGLIR